MDMPNLNLQDAENKLITIALAKADGIRIKAAKLLGIHVRTLFHKIDKRLESEKGETKC